MGVSTPSPRPAQRSKTHSSTREFSPYPGQSQRPSASLAEPVDVEDPGQLLLVHPVPERQPVGPVVGHVVAAERQHRERVAPQVADGPCGGRRRLRRHDRAEEDPVGPVEGLVDERDDRRPPAAEEDGRDRARRSGPPTRSAIAGSWLAGAVKREFGCAAGVRGLGSPVARPASPCSARAAPRSGPPTRRRRRR